MILAEMNLFGRHQSYINYSFYISFERKRLNFINSDAFTGDQSAVRR